jgi:peptidoglycan/LPS O-acetylase OafA/YrhL
MQKFHSVDGLRGWLACLVVLYHTVQMSGAHFLVGGAYSYFSVFGDGSVTVFIIVSGFVITHLILSKPEPYLAYISRRFMRLFPVFAVCCVAGVIVLTFARTAVPMSDLYTWPEHLLDWSDAQEQNFWGHLLAHATMLHGAVPNGILPEAQFAFLPSAWIVSLEWQFYIVAPLVVWLMRSKHWGSSLISVLVVLGLAGYSRVLSSQYGLPSFLPAAGQYFLIGIATRLFCKEGMFSAPAAVGLASLGLGFLLDQFAAGVWVGFVAYLFCQRNSTDPWNHRYIEMADGALLNRTSLYLGSRTYTIYLAHYPVLITVLTLLAVLGVHEPGLVALGLVILGWPLTIAAAECLSRFVRKLTAQRATVIQHPAPLH